MASPEAANYTNVQETTIFNRNNVGRALEIGGALFGLVEALNLKLVPALIGGAIYLLGNWIVNTGKSGETKQ